MPRPLPETLIARDEEFRDFATREIRYFDRDHIKRLKLLLPASPAMDRLLASRTKLAEAKEKRYVRATDARRDAERQVRSRQVHPPSPSALSRKPDKDRGATEREELRTRFDAERAAIDCSQTSCGTRVQVYRWDEPLKLIERQANPDRSMVERDSALFEQLKKLGAFRAVASPAALDQTLDALKRLRSQQPHFDGVIELIEGRIYLAREMAVPLHLPPVLLVGPPGVGKTHFTLQLAEALGRPIHRHSFDSSHTSDALGGSDRHWANTQPGLMFNSVCMGDRADPVVVLDEIDKACIGYRSSNPLTPLHGLLEPLTARAITDISVGLEFDASHVFWVATANDLRLVPETIQTRFRIFHIQPPSAEQAIELAQTVASAVHARYPAFEDPDRRLTILLAHLTPREQTQVLEQAYARALLNGRKYLNMQDLPAELLAEETGDPSSAPFLH